MSSFMQYWRLNPKLCVGSKRSTDDRARFPAPYSGNLRLNSCFQEVTYFTKYVLLSGVFVDMYVHEQVHMQAANRCVCGGQQLVYSLIRHLTF